MLMHLCFRDSRSAATSGTSGLVCALLQVRSMNSRAACVVRCLRGVPKKSRIYGMPRRAAFGSCYTATHSLKVWLAHPLQAGSSSGRIDARLMRLQATVLRAVDRLWHHCGEYVRRTGDSPSSGCFQQGAGSSGPLQPSCLEAMCRIPGGSETAKAAVGRRRERFFRERYCTGIHQGAVTPTSYTANYASL